MKQRGFGLVVYLIAAAVIASSVFLWGQYRFGQGVDKERARNLNAIMEHEATLSKTRREHNDQIEALAKKSTANTEAANRKIRELLSTNKVLADWWLGFVVTDAAAYAWLLDTTSNNPLRRGSLASGTDTVAGKAGETN